MSRVVLAMSGGVDSSVAAYLLQEQGHDVIGVFMRHGADSLQACEAAAKDVGEFSSPSVDMLANETHGCCTAADALDARRVADRLGIPFYALNLRSEFRRVIDYFVAEYASGRTPNPCVMCNTWIKFGRLFDYADSVGAEFVATGHYARIRRDGDPGTPKLCRGVDEAKDQSYVLFGVARQDLSRMLFPVGEHCKLEIRDIASRIGLRVADKPDSQEICFVAKGRHGEFVRAVRGDTDAGGEIVTTDGCVVGQHGGIEQFTVGQRKGLGVALGERYFVVRIEADSRRVVIGRRHESACRMLTANRTNWLWDPPSVPFRCQAKIRYNGPATGATVTVYPGERMRVELDEPRHGVAPGQAAVCYQGERVLGGGWIE